MNPDGGQSTRAVKPQELLDLMRRLNDAGVDYLLIGGQALALHGYTRATDDIDLLLPPDKQVGEKIKAVLMLLPDQAVKDMNTDWFVDGENIRVCDAFVIDLMFNAAGHGFAELKDQAVTVYLGDVPVRTVSLEGLLLTKKTLRAQDAADRLVLERAIQAMQQP